ncbi:MAG: TolC family outer membrane protein [Alphaproteobacteria bacterium]|nr:TolC family outer membrane protein [Alphaproteobacteria bacterium]
MKKYVYLLCLTMFANASQASVLNSVLVKTYNNNPTIRSMRQTVKSNDENVAQALSGWRPAIQASGSVSYEDKNTSPVSSSDGNNTSESVLLSVSQPLYKGGETVASVRSAKNKVKSYHENLKKVENTVLLSAVKAYVDVIRDRAILDLNDKNVKVLEKKLEATKSRFEVGELTQTDVSQAEASLSEAIADRVSAKSDLNSSISYYQSIVGEYPHDLKDPILISKIPASQTEAINLAMKYNPDIRSAIYLEKASKDDVNVKYAGLLPEVTITGGIRKNYDVSDYIDDTDNSYITANLTIPLYKSGSVSSKIRQAKHLSNQKSIDVVKTKREVSYDIVRAWQTYQAAISTISARELQIEANDIALKGVQEEELVGSRTVIDVLDAEQDLLDSKVDLIKSHRDKIYKSYELLSKIGCLTAKDLKLDVDYWNPEDNYNKVKNKWWGVGVN